MLSVPLEGETQDVAPRRANPGVAETDFDPIRAAIQGLRFGEVRLIIQDGVVIQIDRLEKRRLK
jgi:hypothetical protein